MQGSGKPEKPKTHDFSQTKSNQYVGHIILIILTVAGGIILINWRVLDIIPILSGLLFFGLGVVVYGSYIIFPTKDIMAQLVSIDEASEYMQSVARYLLKFQDENGKYYTFYKQDMDFEDIELRHVYKITVKGSKVKEIGNLISASTHSLASGPESKSLNYMSGLYYPRDPFFREMEKIEMGIMVILFWFAQLILLILLVRSLPIIDSETIGYAVGVCVVARCLYADYVAKVDEMNKPDEH